MLLLPKVQQRYLQDSSQFTKAQHQRCIRSRLNKKLRLLETNGVNVAELCSGVSKNCNGPDILLGLVRIPLQTWIDNERIENNNKSYSNFFLFCTLTGLHASECVNCIRLIKNPETFKTYYDSERQALCHYKFPDTFIRRTKADYISIVDKQLLQIVQDIDKIPTYNGLKMTSRRRNLSMNLKYCRKIYASWLRQKAGIESEIVDLLQGRVPKSVFVRHYLTPSLDYKDRVLQALNELRQHILY